LIKKIFSSSATLLFFHNRTDSEPYIRHTTSNGAAAGSSWEHSVYSAFAEAIERDAFVIHYLNKLSPPQIDLRSINNKDIKKLLESYERYNLELYILDITTDIKVPVFLALVIDRAINKAGTGQAVSIDMISGFDVEKIIFDSMYSILRGMSTLRNEKIRQR